MKDKVLNQRYVPLCFIKNKLFAYQKEKFFLIDINSCNARKLCEIKIEDPRRLFCFCRIGERLSHISAYCGMEVDNGAIVAFNRGIYFISNTGEVKREHDFLLSDMRRPLNFYKVENVKGFENMILYPEYSGNPNHGPMRIFQRNKGKWKTIYTFPANTIKHIHAVISDPFRDRVIILTGDDGDECAIWEAKNNFKKVTRIIGSSQKYRACCAKAYPEGLLIITDSPYNQNYIYMLNEKTKTTDVIMRIPGPVVSYTHYKNDLIFSTTVECSKKHIFKYFTYKKGEGIRDNYVHLYKGNLYDGFNELTKYPKDFLPMPSFGFGNILFPNGEMNGKIFYYPTAVLDDAKLRVIDI